MSLCKEALFCLLVSFLIVKKNCLLGLEDVENMTEMDCLKVRKLSQVHLYLVMHISAGTTVPFSLSPSPDFLALSRAVTQIGSHMQTYIEECQEVEKVSIRVAWEPEIGGKIKKRKYQTEHG